MFSVHVGPTKNAIYLSINVVADNNRAPFAPIIHVRDIKLNNFFGLYLVHRRTNKNVIILYLRKRTFNYLSCILNK